MNLRDLVRQGVARKKRAAKAASEETSVNPRDGMTNTSEELLDRSRTQDEFSIRAKNSGHGKKTADKWNQ